MGLIKLCNGIPIKYLSLIILVVQNSALILVMRYTRANVEEDKLYLASTAVVMSEVIKSIVCLVVLYLAPESRKRSLKRLTSLLNRELILNWRETAKLAFPAALYLIQNNLQYVAASNLDAATFQVTYQLKILTTAFFSVLILKKNLSKLKWIALALLTVGIALVVLPKGASTAVIAYITGNTTITDSTAETTAIGNQSNLQGFVAVLTACMLSGLAGVYFEKILKAPAPKPAAVSNNTNNTEDWSDDDDENKKVVVQEEDNMDDESLAASNQIWIRNIQMSFFSVLLGLVFVVMLQDGTTIVERGFFVNYTPLTWTVIAIQAVGGLIVALVVKYADNILKGFATSISIILSSVVSVWLFNFTFSGSFLLGAALVIYATYLYGL
ncbi:DNA-binding transcription factor [Mucor velutinosus]|uniref:DNA-binding transcription factor n=1 Tax=Mucor velutinosus TaxID=708070 RepID=A0AAN7I3R1_9FUNG|nr:DNA-binding transcription factor [Mucor velutinosus]